jgi:ParB family chromosome partitioning protein
VSLTDLTVRLLKDLAERPNPRADIGVTAQRFNMPAARIKELVAKYGWPHPESMAKAAAVLEGKTTEPTPVPAPAAAPAELGSSRVLRLADLSGHPSNPADRVDDIDELAASITRWGQLQPIVVTEHPNHRGWLILDGHRRHAALKMAGQTHADCVVRPNLGGDIDDQLVLMLIANIHRRDLTAMEKAYAFGDLRDRRKMTLDQIAERASLTRGTISYYLSLLELDADTQAKVQTGEIHVSTAIEAVKKVRRDTRRARGDRPVGHPVVLEPAWFTRRHPLADTVKNSCTHSTRPKVGQLGCGECWENAIRADAARPAEAAS